MFEAVRVLGEGVEAIEERRVGRNVAWDGTTDTDVIRHPWGGLQDLGAWKEGEMACAIYIRSIARLPVLRTSIATSNAVAPGRRVTAGVAR